MPKTPSFDCRKTAKGWLLNVPGSVSDTGRKRRRYFKTRDEAKAESQRLRDIFNGHRDKATDIRPHLAEDATRAAATLEVYGVTLAQASAFYVQHHDARAKAPTVTEAWEAAVKRRQNHRPATLSNLKGWQKKLPEWFMGLNLLDVTGQIIAKALDEITGRKGEGSSAMESTWQSGRRQISLVFGDAVKAEQVPENPAAKVQSARAPEKEEDVSTYSPAELRKLLGACKPYDDGLDRECGPCLAPFAFLAFAGVRPDEIARMRWEDVSLELSNLRIRSATSKTKTLRNVRLNDTLRAWIEAVPADERTGKIVPSRWKEKSARVRREAGIDGKEKQDALRHSYGSYMLAFDKNLEALHEDMGHKHVSTYFTFYHKAVTKREALEYWQTLPEGVKLPTIAAA